MVLTNSLSRAWWTRWWFKMVAEVNGWGRLYFGSKGSPFLTFNSCSICVRLRTNSALNICAGTAQYCATTVHVLKPKRGLRLKKKLLLLESFLIFATFCSLFESLQRFVKFAFFNPEKWLTLLINRLLNLERSLPCDFCEVLLTFSDSRNGESDNPDFFESVMLFGRRK